MGQKICAGWNMPGYMPDSEPADFESFDAAREYIVDELKSVVDGLHTGVLGDSAASEEALTEARAEEEQLLEAIEYASRQTGEFGFTVARYHYWVTAT
jgi:hypothetical protein